MKDEGGQPKSDNRRLNAQRPTPSARWRRVARGVGWGLAGLAGLGTAYYFYQPYRYDLFPRGLPSPIPRVDPDSARLFSPTARVAVVTAHPDDAEFYLGGTLARLHVAGAQISLIVATEGDKAYWPWEDPNRNRRVRSAEQRASAAMYGAREVVFLGYNDGRVHPTPKLVRDVARELARVKPNYVFVFDAAYPPRLSHGDHRAVGEAAERAARQTLPPGTWLLHFSTVAPNWAVDVTPQWPRKMELVRLHRSQFHGRRLAFVSDMLARAARAAGGMVGAQYAEPLRCEKR